eukprot:5167527-Amphidinium_carterae.4
MTVPEKTTRVFWTGRKQRLETSGNYNRAQTLFRDKSGSCENSNTNRKYWNIGRIRTAVFCSEGTPVVLLMPTSTQVVPKGIAPACVSNI